MISRRAFLGGTALSLLTPLSVQARQRETLYNGITRAEQDRVIAALHELT